MKVTTVLVLISIWFLRIKVTEGNYRRIFRGPPQPPRQPPYIKKWQHPPPPPPPPRNQLRPRPIPVKVPPSFKKPIGPPVLTNRHLTPVRSIWKNAPQSFKIATEKPFLSSPTISLAEYDYHIQTNNIPTHTNTIKQVGEKGPIHTIPAPNLSLADKPSNIEQVQSSIPQIYQPQQIVYQNQLSQQTQQQNVVYKQKPPQHQHTIVEIQKSHQYQVTEDDPGHHQQIKLQPIFYEPSPTIGANEIREVNKLSPSPEQLSNLAHAEFLVAPQPEQAQTLTPQELYKLLNLYPQQQLLDSYGLPVAQQPQLQQHLIRQQQAILTTNPHNFGGSYEEQNQRNVQGKQIASRVAGDFGVKPEKENSADALAQAQYIQHYFEHPAENIVEADAQATNNNFDTNEIPKDAFYSTLPNRQAAEVLASLQEAGKINNSQQVKTVESKAPMTIYVPDNYEEESEDHDELENADEGGEKKQERGDYEDDLQGEANEHALAHAQAQYQIDSAYGDRIRTKSQQ